jgi:hypothetical protein
MPAAVTETARMNEERNVVDIFVTRWLPRRSDGEAVAYRKSG